MILILDMSPRRWPSCCGFSFCRQSNLLSMVLYLSLTEQLTSSMAIELDRWHVLQVTSHSSVSGLNTVPSPALQRVNEVLQVS
jgi:hypothetical protein